MMIRTRLLIWMGMLLLIGTPAFADKVAEPPRKMVLTGTVIRQYITKGDTKVDAGLVLKLGGKKRIMLKNHKALRGKPMKNGETAWQWNTKDGKTVDFEKLVGKKIKLTAFVQYSALSSVISVEEGEPDEGKPGAIVVSPNLNNPVNGLPLLLVFAGAIVLVAGGLFGIYKMNRKNTIWSA